MKRVAVFGATGTTGAYSALHLKESGYDVIAIGRRRSDNGFFAQKGIPYYSVDVKDAHSFDILPSEGIDSVVHLAGAMPARMKGYDPCEYIDSVLKGTMNVLEWMRHCGCRQIVFAQSIADILYRFGTQAPIEDDAERRFPLNSDHSVYSICKNAAVNLIEHYHAKYGIRRFVLRLPTIYLYHPDPYYHVDGIKRWMGYRYIIDQAVKGNTLEVWGDPASTKEMVYVKDFARMVQCAVDSELEGGVYNVGCGSPVSIEDQIKCIAEVFAGENESEIVYCPEKPSSPQFSLSIEKAMHDLHYAPSYSFRDMMFDFKHEMETNPFELLWGKPTDYEL